MNKTNECKEIATMRLLFLISLVFLMMLCISSYVIGQPKQGYVTIYLADGGVLVGKIVASDENTIKIEPISGGQITVYKNYIKEIKQGKQTLPSHPLLPTYDKEDKIITEEQNNSIVGNEDGEKADSSNYIRLRKPQLMELKPVSLEIYTGFGLDVEDGDTAPFVNGGIGLYIFSVLGIELVVLIVYEVALLSKDLVLICPVDFLRNPNVSLYPYVTFGWGQFLTDEYKAHGNFGGGVKVKFSNHWGFRFELRFYDYHSRYGDNHRFFASGIGVFCSF
jgi:hypothetical protein